MSNKCVESVIFLDWDGPLLPPATSATKTFLEVLEDANIPLHGMAADYAMASSKHHWIPDPIAVIMITHLAHATNSKIVISSTRRGHGYKNFVEEFEEIGFDRSFLHEDWAVMRSTSKSTRKSEIKEWLNRHPKIKKFVTIDDEALDFDEHIQVCAVNGMLFDNYVQAYEILTGEIPDLTSIVYSSLNPKINNIASVDFIGSVQIIDDGPAQQRCLKRLHQRKETLKTHIADNQPKF